MLDTSIYKQTPKLNSELFKRLIKYARIGLFKIYISEIIEREYLTWIHKESQEAYNNVVKNTEALSKFYEEPDFLGIKLHQNITASIAHTQINEILKKVVENWNDFKKETNAITLPINDCDGKLAMDAYFNGAKPFKDAKNRSDIPDAFVYFSILGLLKSIDKIVFISRDKELTKRITDVKIETFESLADLFSCEGYSIPGEYFTKLQPNDKAHFLFQYFKKEIIKKIKRQIELSEIFPDMEQELINETIGEYKDLSVSAENIELDFETVRVISDLSYLISFTADLVHSISSKATKLELGYAGEERINRLKEKDVNDDGMFDITQETHTQILGNLSISFADSDPLLWEEKVTDTTFFPVSELKEVSISIEDVGKKT